MLNEAKVIAMVPVKDIKKAEAFYSQTLELNKTDENPGGIAYQCGDGKMFVYPTPKAGTAESTAATWEVKDIARVVEWLKNKGLKFEHYDFPGAEYDADGAIHVWKDMKAAWFSDPDGNILGLSQI